MAMTEEETFPFRFDRFPDTSGYPYIGGDYRD